MTPFLRRVAAHLNRGEPNQAYITIQRVGLTIGIDDQDKEPPRCVHAFGQDRTSLRKLAARLPRAEIQATYPHLRFKNGPGTGNGSRWYVGWEWDDIGAGDAEMALELAETLEREWRALLRR